MDRPRILVMLLGAAAAFAAGMAAVRHRGGAMGHRVPGGILIGNGAAHDALSRRLLTSLHGSIAADAAAVARDGARVLEGGCGSDHVSIRLARLHGLESIGLDLDPAMIERARATPTARSTATAGVPRSSPATWPRCHSLMDRSTWS